MQGEVTLQVVGALTCAGLLSLLIITIINAETKHKSIHSAANHTDSEVGSASQVWYILSEKISNVASSIFSTNTTEQSQRLITGGGRRLSWTGPEKEPVVEVPEEEHRLRHGGRRHQGRRRAQGSCYSGNEVLLVIGVTCLLNFAFVLLVMACVHYCSAQPKSDLVSRLESVVVESETESEDNQVRYHWDPGASVVSLHNISSFYRHKTPSHSMEQLLFVD